VGEEIDAAKVLDVMLVLLLLLDELDEVYTSEPKVFATLPALLENPNPIVSPPVEFLG
jgi:hypothetical protein